MSDLFAPYLGLYHTGAHPLLPWWHRESNGINIRWFRADGTWQLEVHSHTSGEILVRRMDLGELDDETLRLRSVRGFHPFGGNIPMHARGALIERVNLKMDSSGETFTDWFVPKTAEDLPAYVDAMLLRLEREFPVPRPPIWHGQCWSIPSVFDGKRLFLHVVTPEDEEHQWIGALLYGPTKYGRDVPWLHPSLLPPSPPPTR